MLGLLQNQSLILPPYTLPSYSNLGFALLGNLLAESIFNNTFANFSTVWKRWFLHCFCNDFSFFQSAILEPLGMSNTGFVFTPDVVSRIAVGYPAAGGVAPLNDLGTHLERECNETK